MFFATCNVTTTTDRTAQIQQALKDLGEMDVLVGIPQEKTTRPGDPVTNAELAFIHTNGSPIRNIPARPFIEPAIEDDRENIASLMSEAIQAALNGNMLEANQKLEQAGMRGQAVSQAWFEDKGKNKWLGNSPGTKARKLKKRSTEPKPLIDTGEMRKSITYVIRRKG